MVPGYLGTLSVSEEDVGPHRGRQEEPGSGGKHEAGGPGSWLSCCLVDAFRDAQERQKGDQRSEGNQMGPRPEPRPISGEGEHLDYLSRASDPAVDDGAGGCSGSGRGCGLHYCSLGGGTGGGKGHLSIWASGHLGKVSGFGGAIWFHWASLARSVPFSGWPIAEESLVGAQLGAEALGRPDLAAALPVASRERERERGREGGKMRGEMKDERKEAERRGRVGEWEREGGTGRVSRWGCYW